MWPQCTQKLMTNYLIKRKTILAFIILPPLSYCCILGLFRMSEQIINKMSLYGTFVMNPSLKLRLGGGQLYPWLFKHKQQEL